MSFSLRHFPYHYTNTAPPAQQFFLPHLLLILPFWSILNLLFLSLALFILLPLLLPCPPLPILYLLLPLLLLFPLPHLLRRSQRHIKPPSRLQAYHCNHVTSTHWCNLVSSHALSASHKLISHHHQQYLEPKTYAEVVQYPHWVAAINTKLKALELNNTWTLIDLPKHKKSHRV